MVNISTYTWPSTDTDTMTFTSNVIDSDDCSRSHLQSSNQQYVLQQKALKPKNFNCWGFFLPTERL